MAVAVKNHTIDWPSVRLDFINENLNAGRVDFYTLKQLATKHKLKYGTVRNKAAAQGWAVDLAQMLEDMKTSADATVLNVQLETEVEVRVRQATFARQAQNKAMAKLNAVPSDKLTVQEAIMLWRWGMQEERAALGLEDNFVAPPPSVSKSNQTREAVRLAMDALRGLRERMQLQVANAEPTAPSTT